MSTALVNKANHVNNTAPALYSTSHSHGRDARVTKPTMRAGYRDTQAASTWSMLPEDVEPLIFKHAGKAVFSLGLTCKYWNLRGREFLTEHPLGRGALRRKYEETYRKKQGCSVLDDFRNLMSSSFTKFVDFDDAKLAQEFVNQLKVSKEPVCLVVPNTGHWITPGIESALALRSHKLTIMEIHTPDKNSHDSIVAAIKAVPSNGFVVLIISSATLTSQNINELWDAIHSHPVVVHIECNGDKQLATGDAVVAWMELLSSKNTNVSSFSLNHCRLDEQSFDTLSALLAEEKGFDQLEVNEAQTSAEHAENLFRAVQTRNASAHSKMALYFAANNLSDFIDDEKHLNLVVGGIYLDHPGSIAKTRFSPIESEESSDGEVDNDSSSVVSDPSSGDEAWGSEFESSGNDSEVIESEQSGDDEIDNDSSSVVGDPSSGDESSGSEFESSHEDSDAIV